MRVRHLLFFVLLIAFASSGCIFSPDNDDEPPPPPPAPECVTATSPDQVMQVFREVYAGRQLDCYRQLLSEDYLFIDQDGGTDTYDDEIRIADKMFNGLEGNTSIIISDITIEQLLPQNVWVATPANDPNFGGFTDSQYRAYVVHIKFQVSGQNLILQVQGPVIYYVKNEGDDENPDYKILGMVDQTYGQ